MIKTYFYLGVNITYYCTCTKIIGSLYPLKVKNKCHVLLELPIFYVIFHITLLNVEVAH